MTDTLAQGTSPDDRLAQSLEAAVTAAPALQHSPGSAVDVAKSGGDTVQRAQAVSHVQTTSAISQAADAQQKSDGGLFGALGSLGHDVLHGLGDVASAGMKVANFPLEEVQHEYRYLHDVEVRHGWGAALGEGLVAGIGAVAGSVLGPEGTYIGAALGGEAATWLAGHVAFRDSWSRTAASTYYSSKVNDRVTFGRDIASLIGLKSGSGQYGALSGMLDGLFDIGLDPISAVGDAAKMAQGTEGLASTGTARALGLNGVDKLGLRGYSMKPDVLDWAMDHPGQYGAFHRAIGQMAGMDEASIALKYPKFAPIADELAAASTKDEVATVLRTKMHAATQFLPDQLPSMSYMRLPGSNLRTWAASRDAAATDAARKLRVIGRPASAVTGLLSPRRWADRFTPLPGVTMDLDKLKIDGTQFDPTSTDPPVDAALMVRFGQGENVAREFINSWRGADIRARAVLYRNAIVDSTFGLAGYALKGGEHAEDKYADVVQSAAFRQKMAEILDHSMVRGDPDATGVYGTYINGKNALPLSEPETEREFGGGVLESQKSQWAIPNMPELKRAAHALTHSRDLYGAIDDWTMEHFTQPIFKRYILMSVSYAMHITGAEMAMNVLRQGAGDTIKGAFYKSAARLNYKIESGGDSATVRVLQAGSRLFGVKMDSLDELKFNLWLHDVYDKIPQNEWDLERAAEVMNLTHGAGTPYAVSAGHNYGEVENQRERISNGLLRRAGNRPVRDSDRYTIYGKESHRYMKDWHRAIGVYSRDPGVQKATQAYLDATRAGKGGDEATLAAEKAWETHLRAKSPEELAGYERAFAQPATDPAEWDPIRSWAHHGFALTKGVAFASDDTPNMGILRYMANPKDNKLTRRYLENVDPDRRPLGVMGRVEVPSTDGSLARIASTGFRGLNSIVQHLSREPMFVNEYRREYRLLEPGIGTVYSADEATTIAMRQAAQKSVRFVHNLHDRTQISSTLRNWAPFWFAQEQAYRRMGRMLAENPGAFRRYQLMLANVHDLAQQQQASDGNRYFTLPGLGWLDAKAAVPLGHLGIPIASINPVEFGGSWSATSVMFPMTQGTSAADAVRPGWGPAALIPAKLAYAAVSNVGKRYSDFTPITGSVEGLEDAVFGQTPMSASMLNELVPNTALQRTLEAVQGYEGDPDAAFVSAMDQTMQSLMYQQNEAFAAWEKGGKKGDAPSIVPPPNAGYKEMQSFISRVKNMTFINFMGRMMVGFVSPVSAELEINNWGLTAQLNADITKAGSVNQGMQNFLLKNPNATPYTVSQSAHPGSQASLPESMDGQQWLNDNAAFVQKYPGAAVFFLPQLKDNTYSAAAYNEQIADGLRTKNTPSQFLDGLYTAAGDQTYYDALAIHENALKGSSPGTTAYDNEEANWTAYVKQLQIQQPTWFANSHLFSPAQQALAQQTIAQLQQIFTSGQYPQGAQADGIKGLLSNYEVAAQDFANAGNSYNYASQQKQVKEGWTKYLDALKISNPELKPIISSVFSGVFYQVT